MDRFHQLESMRAVVRRALPNVTVESINPLLSCRLLRFFSVKISDGRTLILSLPPPPTLRLLRSERATNLSEALVTKWILEEVLPPSIQGEEHTHESTGTHQHVESQAERDEQKINPEGIRDSRRDVLRFLPILVVHSPSSAGLGSPFNIFEPPRGTTISELQTPLTIPEKKVVDLQRGQLVRQLSSLAQPNGLFGPVIAAIGSQLPSINLGGTRVANVGFRSARTWKQAFHSLLEGVLRDAEDMAVTISYEPIRGYFNRLGHVMDGVTTARLAILDASDDFNVLVSRSTKRNEEGEETHPPPPSSQETKQSETGTATEKVARERGQEGDEGGRPPDVQQPTITVTGLRDWSNCVFGDPLFAEVFSQNPTSEFLHGFRSSPNDDDDDDLVEDPESASVRLLLYECYHATVSVVKTFYRPGPDSSDREIAARRRLAAALRRLEEVDEEAAGKRPRRPSANVEAWPVKKPKGDSSGPGPSAQGSGGPS